MARIILKNLNTVRGDNRLVTRGGVHYLNFDKNDKISILSHSGAFKNNNYPLKHVRQKRGMIS